MQSTTLIDVHSHLYDNDLVHDLKKHLKKAKESNIQKIILVAEDLETSKQILQLTANNDMLQPCIGVHPCNVSSKNQILEMCDLIMKNQKKLVGIGEVGLDFSPYFVKSTETMTTEERKELQRWALSKFVELSLKLDLPLNVHSRSAGRPVIDLLQKCGKAEARIG
jgi:TatD DNase family protein